MAYAIIVAVFVAAFVVLMVLAHKKGWSNKTTFIPVCVLIFIFLAAMASASQFSKDNSNSTKSSVPERTVKELREEVEKKIQMIETPQSSAFTQIGYLEEEKCLAVTFRNGGTTYYFMQVPVHVWEEFKYSDSLGTFFNHNIKGVYKYTKSKVSDTSVAVDGEEETIPPPNATRYYTSGGKTSSSSTKKPKEKIEYEYDYVANRSSGVFHEPDCGSVTQMDEANKVYCYDTTRDDLIAAGYRPCGNCNP